MDRLESGNKAVHLFLGAQKKDHSFAGLQTREKRNESNLRCASYKLIRPESALLSRCYTQTRELLCRHAPFSYPRADGLVVGLALCLWQAEKPIDHFQHG